jgi:DNA-binding CsgD family transcriptional regulator
MRATVYPVDAIPPGSEIWAGGYEWSWAFVMHRPAPGHPSRAVGTDGIVWRRCKVGWQPASCSINRSGYQVLSRASGATGNTLVHRVVLEAFIGPCPPGLQCRHLNGNPADNRLDNLCWGTPAQNTEDKRRHGTLMYGAQKPRSHTTMAEWNALNATIAAATAKLPGNTRRRRQDAMQRREKVIILKAAGLTVAEITKKLRVDRATVRRHLQAAKDAIS